MPMSQRPGFDSVPRQGPGTETIRVIGRWQDAGDTTTPAKLSTPELSPPTSQTAPAWRDWLAPQGIGGDEEITLLCRYHRSEGVRMPSKRRQITPTHLKPLLSIEEAAEMLGIHRCTLYRSIERGDFPLPLFQINARWRVPRKAVEALIEGLPAQVSRPFGT